MTKLQEKPIDEGWSVHVYDCKRRLLCTLNSSHGWTFLLGGVFGLLLAVVWVNIGRSTQPAAPPASPSALPQLKVD